MGKPIVIVGAGLAGLVCARRLHRAGLETIVIEKLGDVGGRVWTDTVDGYLIDRGFQLLLTAYPYVSREVDFNLLDLKKFTPGCQVLWNGSKHDVLRDSTVRMALSGFLYFSDKLRLRGLSTSLATLTPEEVWLCKDQSAEEDLRTTGFGPTFVERFARPFFGGIFLDRSLSVSERVFRYVWKMLSEGHGAVPAKGMQEIPRQIARDLPDDHIRLNTTVDSLLREQGRVLGVRLESGEEIQAAAVVVATDAPTAQRLTGIPMPQGAVSCTTVSFGSESAPMSEPILVVNGNQGGIVNHFAVLSNVAPSLAPPGKHLLSATIIGIPDLSDDQLATVVRKELAGWFPGHDVSQWKLLRINRMPFVQYSQQPGFADTLPTVETAVENLYLAGEFTTYSSIDGACLSGAQCAGRILAAQERAAS